MAKQIVLLSQLFNIICINVVDLVSFLSDLIDVVPNDTQGVHYRSNIFYCVAGDLPVYRYLSYVSSGFH